MNAVERKFAADLKQVAVDTKQSNTPATQALSEVARVFGSSAPDLVSFTHVKDETYEVAVQGFELKRGRTLVVTRDESIVDEMWGENHVVRVVTRVLGIPVARTTINSSADMVQFCTQVPDVEIDPFA